MNYERNEHSNCRNSYRRRQVDCPTFPQEQPDARDDVCKARDKIEPKNERNDVAGSTSCFHVAKQGFSADNDGGGSECDCDQRQNSGPARSSGCCWIHDFCLCYREMLSILLLATSDPARYGKFSCLPLDIDQATNWTFSTKCALRFSQLGEWPCANPNGTS